MKKLLFTIFLILIGVGIVTTSVFALRSYTLPVNPDGSAFIPTEWGIFQVENLVSSTQSITGSSTITGTSRINASSSWPSYKCNGGVAKFDGSGNIECGTDLQAAGGGDGVGVTSSTFTPFGLTYFTDGNNIGATSSFTISTSTGVIAISNNLLNVGDFKSSSSTVTTGYFTNFLNTSGTISNFFSSNLQVSSGTIDNFKSSNVAITGGSITGITDLAVADGGTGVSALDDILGTANQITVGAGANTVIGGDVTLSLPSFVDLTNLRASSGTITTLWLTDLIGTSSTISRLNVTGATSTNLQVATKIIADYATASRCARFDASNQLVAATGDCASGDTTGGSGVLATSTTGTYLSGNIAFFTDSMTVSATNTINLATSTGVLTINSLLVSSTYAQFTSSTFTSGYFTNIQGTSSTFTNFFSSNLRSTSSTIDTLYVGDTGTPGRISATSTKSVTLTTGSSTLPLSVANIQGVTLWTVREPITITQVDCINEPNSSSSYIFNISHGTNRQVTSTLLFTALTNCINTSTIQSFTSFSDATVASAETIQLHTDAASTTGVTFTIHYKTD